MSRLSVPYRTLSSNVRTRLSRFSPEKRCTPPPITTRANGRYDTPMRLSLIPPRDAKLSVYDTLSSPRRCPERIVVDHERSRKELLESPTAHRCPMVKPAAIAPKREVVVLSVAVGLETERNSGSYCT